MSDLITLANFTIYILSGVFFFLMGFQLIIKKEKSYVVWHFLIGMLSAGVGSLVAALYHIPYISDIDYFAWDVGSLIYYIFITIAIVLIFSTGVGIYMGRDMIKYSYILIVMVVPIILSYVLGFVTLEQDVPDMSTDMNGVILLYGSVLILLISNLALYLRTYMVTKLDNIKFMIAGISIIISGAIIGAIGDIVFGRIFDPFGLLTNLLGIYLMFQSIKSGAEAS